MSFAEFLFTKNMATNAQKDTPPPSSKDDRGAQREIFRKKRTYEKIQISKKLSKLEELLAHEPLTANERSRLTRLDEEVQQRMKTLHSYQEQVIMSGSEDPENDEEIDYLDSYEETVEDTHRRVLECLKPYKHKSRNTPSSSSSSSEEEDEDGYEDPPSRSKPTSRKHKDPINRISVEALNFDARTKITEAFSGKDRLKYKTFKKSFQGLDRKMDEIGFSEAEKLIELKKCLEGDALRFIERLPDDDENYKAALEILDDIYFNNAKFAEKVILALIDTPKMSNTTESIKNAYQAIMAADQTLTGLNISPEQLGQILFIVICETKLNNRIREKWSAVKSQKRNTDHPMGHNATKKDLMSLLRDAFVLSEDIDQNSSNKGRSHDDHKSQNQGKRHHGSFGTQQTNKKDDHKTTSKELFCVFCKTKGHKIQDCRTLKDMSISDRWNHVKDKRLCPLCFSPDHRSDNCNFRPCNIDGCNKKHSRWLHKVVKPSQAQSHATKKASDGNTTESNSGARSRTEPKSEENRTSLAARTNHSKTTTGAILQTCLAWAISPSGEKHKVRVFLDCGSELSLITRKTSAMMGLNGKETSLSLDVAGGGTTPETKEKEVNFRLESTDGKYVTPPIKATTTKTISTNLREIPITVDKFPHLRGIRFTEDFPRKSAEVDIMIGIDHYHMLVTGTAIMGKNDEPAALPTKLGYILTGLFQTSEKRI